MFGSSLGLHFTGRNDKNGLDIQPMTLASCGHARTYKSREPFWTACLSKRRPTRGQHSGRTVPIRILRQRQACTHAALSPHSGQPGVS